MATAATAPTALLFGAPALHAGEVTHFAPQRRFQLLALLAMHSGEWVPRDHVAALFWPERGNTEARRNLRKVVFKAHEVPGTQGLQASEHALRWDVDTDLQAFARALQVHRFDDAVALRRGPLLDGMDDGDSAAWADWLAAQRSFWQQAWHDAALQGLQRQANPAQRITAARTLLQADSLDEAAVAALIDAHLALGQAGLAQRCYSDYASRLTDELGIEPSRQLRDRFAAAPAAPTSASTVPPAAASPDSNRFVGRRTEMAELGLLLANPDVRLVTIVGPGGIGKSSLARRALDGAGALFDGGTWWLELQDLNDIAAVIARLAQQLGLEIQDAGDAVEQFARRLGAPRAERARCLLVLDNAEHLPDLPAWLDRLLAACPRLTLLLTSRVRSHSAYECLLPLSGLALPDEDSHDLEAASTFDAVTLFDLRARAAQRGFSLARHLRAVISVCEAVAGMPLAIELAASWVRLLTPEAIARELAGAGGLLERDPALRGQPARPQHHSMRAVLDHSWQLLTALERLALAALSVFEGGFTRAAAQRVAVVPMPLLSSLADKSLLAVDGSGRFGLHPLVAAYAAQQLEEDPGRHTDVRRRHAEFFALHLAALAPHAIGDQRLLIAGVTEEFANCRAAWQHTVDLQRADLVYAMVRALWSFFENRGRLREGIELLSPALALPDHLPASPRALARLRHGLSMLHHRKGNAREALQLASSGAATAEDCGDTEAYVGCLLNAGMCLWNDGRLQEARLWFERGLAVARQRADRHCVAWSLGNLGVCLQILGDLEGAKDCLTRALAGSRELGDQYNVAVHLNNLGAVHRELQDWAAARQCYDEGIPHCAACGIESIAAYLRLNLANLHLRCKEPEAARLHYEAALVMGQDSGLRAVEWAADLGLAQIDIGASALPSALQRLRRVACSARPASFLPYVVAAAAAYGDVHAARGDATAAAQVWRMALAQGSLQPSQSHRLREKLAALALPQEAGATAAEPTLDEVLHQLETEASSRVR